ncbi:MAG: hypothetical protein N2690_11980 [Rhodocyclaceae bacterium]|nr:hypothetical protein [Rhodocyclaceae bacterium]
MARRIPEFTAREKHLVSQTLVERYGQPVPVQSIQSEIQLDLLKDELTLVPALTWQVDVCHFVVFKTGDARFRCQFYYTDAEQFGTAKTEYDSLGDCVIDLLQVQAQHEEERQRKLRALNAVDFSQANDGEDYHGPLMV